MLALQLGGSEQRQQNSMGFRPAFPAIWLTDLARGDGFALLLLSEVFGGWLAQPRGRGTLTVHRGSSLAV